MARAIHCLFPAIYLILRVSNKIVVDIRQSMFFALEYGTLPFQPCAIQVDAEHVIGNTYNSLSALLLLVLRR